MTTHNKESGRSGESIAVDFLTKKGYRILQRNYRYGYGEIDIIADDHGVLVFVEVKARFTRKYGEPEESVSMRQRKQLRKTASGYLFQHHIDDTECRFDVIAILYKGDVPIIRHLESAF